MNQQLEIFKILYNIIYSVEKSVYFHVKHFRVWDRCFGAFLDHTQMRAVIRRLSLVVGKTIQQVNFFSF